MKSFTLKSLFLFAGFSFVLASCGGDAAEGSESGEGEAAAEAVMTTQEFIDEANKLGAEEFEKKYPEDAEITLKGEVRVPATWKDKVAAKFGTSMNDLPLTADFMFEANGGKEETRKKVSIGTEVHFTGKLGFFFFKDDKLSSCTFEDCIAK